MLRARGVRFFLVHFCSPPLSCTKPVPFESTGIGLQNVRKLDGIRRQTPRYTRWYAVQKLLLTRGEKYKVFQRERLQSKFSACQGSHSGCILCHERMKDWKSHPGQWRDSDPPAVYMY